MSTQSLAFSRVQRTNWWRSVQIGSLKFSSWSAVDDSASLQQVQAIFKETSPVYLIVLETVDPLAIVGVIFSKTLESLVASISRFDKAVFTRRAVQIEGLVTTSYKLMPISGGEVGDLEDAFNEGFQSAILYRTTHVLPSSAQSNIDDREGAVVEKRHIIAVVIQDDLNKWIGQVEGHHNMIQANNL